MKSEHGSAIVYVFIGIALFGALMFMFSRGASQNTSKLSDQEARITATEIIEFSQSLQKTVQKLMMDKGCSENEISFENDVVAGYENPNSPTDLHCHVFKTEGGKMKWQFPPSTITPPEGNYIFSKTRSCGWGTGCIGPSGPSWGPDTLDLAFYLRNIPANVCKTINQLLNNKKSILHYLDSNGIPIEDNGLISTYPGLGVAITNTSLYFKGNFSNSTGMIGDSEVFPNSGSVICTKQFNADEYILIGNILSR